MTADAIDPDAPSPWVMCPNCAGVWLVALVTIERDADRGTHVSAWSPSHLTCRACGHEFSINTDEEIA